MEEALVAWMNTLVFPAKPKIHHILELYDGIILTEILYKMYHSY